MVKPRYTVDAPIVQDAHVLADLEAAVSSITGTCNMDPAHREAIIAQESDGVAAYINDCNWATSTTSFWRLARAGRVGIGDLLAELRQEYVEVDSLRVLPQYWGHGVGSLLAAELCKWTDEHHPDAPILAWVATDNTRALGFWEKNGFRLDTTIYSDSSNFRSMVRQPLALDGRIA